MDTLAFSLVRRLSLFLSVARSIPYTQQKAPLVPWRAKFKRDFSHPDQRYHGSGHIRHKAVCSRLSGCRIARHFKPAQHASGLLSAETCMCPHYTPRHGVAQSLIHAEILAQLRHLVNRLESLYSTQEIIPLSNIIHQIALSPQCLT